MAQTESQYINKRVNLQVALYELRQPRPFYFASKTSLKKQELKVKLGVVTDVHAAYCRGEIELHGEFGNPYCGYKSLLSLEKRL